MTLSIQPFAFSPASEISLLAAALSAGASSASGSKSRATPDVVDIGNRLGSGAFSGGSGPLGDLYRAQSGTPGTAAAAYLVGLSISDVTLIRTGAGVARETRFTAVEFAEFAYTSGSSGAPDPGSAASSDQSPGDSGPTQSIIGAAVEITASVATRQSKGATRAGFSLTIEAGEETLRSKTDGGGGQTSFIAEEFARLSFSAGSNSPSQHSTAAARSGPRAGSGARGQLAESATLEFAVGVAGTGSFNDLNGLTSSLTEVETELVDLMREVGILLGAGETNRQTAAGSVAAGVSDLGNAPGPSVGPTPLSPGTQDGTPATADLMGLGASLAMALLSLDPATPGASPTPDRRGVPPRAVTADTTA